MKLLKIEKEQGHFRDEKGAYQPIVKIRKEDLLRLVNWTLDEKDVEFDAYDEQAIKHQAHQVVYKSVVQKLSALRERKEEFLDQSERLFLEEYERYK